jgi:hypothetical protein
MPKYECLASDDKILGVMKAENEQRALDKARALNKNVVAARLAAGEAPPTEAEAAVGPAKELPNKRGKRRKGSAATPEQET